MRLIRPASLLLSALVICALSDRYTPAATPQFDPPAILLNGHAAPPASSSVCGFSLVASQQGPQVALLETTALIASLQPAEEVSLTVSIRDVDTDWLANAEATLLDGRDAEITFGTDKALSNRTSLTGNKPVRLQLPLQPHDAKTTLRLGIKTRSSPATVRLGNLRVSRNGQVFDVPLSHSSTAPQCPPPVLPALRPPIEQALIEWDWRMQDGIDTARQPSTYAAAVQRTLERGDALLRDLQDSGIPLQAEAAQWRAFQQQWEKLSADTNTTPSAWEDLWRSVHVLRRRIAFSNPLTQVGPLVFVKQVPSVFSHQLTQYYGACARPGGGIFVLDQPGKSMQCRQLAAALPQGSCQHVDVSYDGQRLLFAYCRAETDPADRTTHPDRFYHLFEIGADGSNLRQLTDGPFDDFSPRYLPDGKIIFISTRRQGFHRCGRGPCPIYTLALANADGSDPHPISFHETHEWDPAVLHDGRVIYTRWDYVDRHAVFYEQLWSVRPDGSDVRIFYGNNTFNPVGVWEARPVPGSNRVMATAAAHHAMTAGSIILLDITRGVDGLPPITRLTPDALFPESEVPVGLPPSGVWHAPTGVPNPPPLPPEAARWPGHCYRSPFPLSEKYFFAAYSFDRLIGEPTANSPNMFGLYQVDAFGNKELIYRDLNIASLWPAPLRAQPTPPTVPSVCEPSAQRDGTFFVHNVYQSWPQLSPLAQATVKRLRIVQVLPKSTPHANDPPVGLANASPGKQVLGTVPVEPDGSAYFRAPAGLPLAFQALDDQGRAVQVMRSVTYLQPGESASCVGCHEPRSTAPPPRQMAQALTRLPSAIEPGPDGSNPLSFPLLVQPVLDKHCIGCHNPTKPDARVVLTSQPQGHYTASYNALAPLVPFSAWTGSADFRQVNSEPLSTPGFFGARASRLMKLLDDGHYDVALTAEDRDRLITWMDANALFYGTFDPADQARQLRGERIQGPKMQ